MILIVFFIVVLFLYSLLSRRPEQTVVTAPIIFTAAGMCWWQPCTGSTCRGWSGRGGYKLAEVGLVMMSLPTPPMWTSRR